VRLCTSDQEVFQAIRYLECDPEIAGEPPEELTISIERYRSYYRIWQGEQLLGEQITPQAVTEMLHAKLTLLALAEFPTAPIIHAATLKHGGHRVLLVGPKGAGKTVLTLYLIQQGYDIEGDENVFVVPHGAITRPRGLRVKRSAAATLPYLSEILVSAPYYEPDPGVRIYNLDPRQAGAGFWRIEAGRVDAVVLLRPNHGGDSSLRPVPPLALVREVLEESAFPETGRAKALSAITQVIGNARGFDLSLGDLAGAGVCIGRVFETLVAGTSHPSANRLEAG
jgi:hypothetical protein